MIRLIATDLDNTLLDKSGGVPPETVAALAEAEKKGVVVTVATGRSFASARGVAELIGGNGLAICYNGSQIRRLADGALLYSGCVDKDVQQAIIEFVHERGLYLQQYDNDVIVVETLRLDKHNDPDLRFAPHREVGDFLKEPLFDTPKMMIAADPAEVPVLQAELEEMFAGRIFCAQSEPHLIEIMPAAVNKGTALAALCQEFGIRRDEVMALGDNTNDMHLLQAAGLAIAVANAVPQLQEYADYVCRGERSEGFREAIEKFILAPDAAMAVEEWENNVR
ncbi:MAG: Cof-type HAD-IIB family hydrolase [Clostridiales bacterium]|nr:Cof-type HAD-IIB family hydrolase [Clostridiales bacterium]